MKEFSQFKIIEHLDKVRSVLQGGLAYPVTVELDPTNQCNHNCTWCMDSQLRRRKPHSLKLDAVLRLADELGGLGIAAVTVKGGGEPLVYPHIDQTLYRLKDAGVDCGLITNGELLADHANAIVDCCTWVRVSIAGSTNKTHTGIHRPSRAESFNRILEGVGALSGRLFLGVVMVVGAPNLFEMEQTAQLAKDLGAKYIAYKPAVLPGNKRFTPEQLEVMDRSYCTAKNNLEDDSFAVSGSRVYNFGDPTPSKPYDICKAHHLIGIVCADGGVYACCATRGNSKYQFGSIYQQGFGDIWRSEQRKSVLRTIDSGSCRHLCVGRTSYMRYDHYNNLFSYLGSANKPHRNFL